MKYLMCQKVPQFSFVAFQERKLFFRLPWCQSMDSAADFWDLGLPFSVIQVDHPSSHHMSFSWNSLKQLMGFQFMKFWPCSCSASLMPMYIMNYQWFLNVAVTHLQNLHLLYNRLTTSIFSVLSSWKECFFKGWLTLSKGRRGEQKLIRPYVWA